MIVIMKPGTQKTEIENLMEKIKSQGFEIHPIQGVSYCIFGIVGDTSQIDPDDITINDHVDRVMRVQEPFKKANRNFHPQNSIVEIAGEKIGANKLAVMAGPCSIESSDQILEIAQAVKSAGANFLRGGAFKPRTSPYAFQGMGEEGLELLQLARQKTGMPIVSELMSIDKLDLFVDHVDVIQIGARNMQNFDLLKEVGKTNVPILLKRGLSATIEEWIMSAEYIMASGNENVIFCERGIRTFERYTRNTLDLSAIPAIKKLSHLPIIVDPSHAAGLSWMVPALAKAAIAVGADGLMIEVHNDPAKALCDGAQSIKPDAFAKLMIELKAIAQIVGREI